MKNENSQIVELDGLQGPATATSQPRPRSKIAQLPPEARSYINQALTDGRDGALPPSPVAQQSVGAAGSSHTTCLNTTSCAWPPFARPEALPGSRQINAN